MNESDKIKDIASKITTVTKMLDKEIGLDNLVEMAGNYGQKNTELVKAIKSARKIYGNHMPIYHNTMPIYDSITPALIYLERERPELFEQVCEIFDIESDGTIENCTSNTISQLENELDTSVYKLQLYLNKSIKALTVIPPFLEDPEREGVCELIAVLSVLVILLEHSIGKKNKEDGSE